MEHDVHVYDLGEVRLDEPKKAPRPASPQVTSRPAAPARHDAARPDRVGASLTGSLSLFVPGAGQLLGGEPALGLFFASGLGFAFAALHALVTTLDRLLPTLDVLRIPRVTAGASLVALLLAAVTLHLAAVVHAYSLHGDRPGSVHPSVAGLASAVVPGWGQILVGHRVRAALLLGSLWTIAIAWLVVTPRGLGILRDLGVSVPRGLRDGFGPVTLVTAPAVVWALAVHDAVMGAVARRRS